MSSAYCPCACRGCFEVAIADSSYPDHGTLCAECAEAGCDADGCAECSRDDEYTEAAE